MLKIFEDFKEETIKLTQNDYNLKGAEKLSQRKQSLKIAPNNGKDFDASTETRGIWKKEWM